MFRFIMMILLMAACFLAGKMLAQANFCPIVTQAKYIEQIDVSLQDILALTRNAELKTQFPDLYGQLMALLASPQIQEKLVDPSRSDSPIYQRLVDLVTLINLRLNPEIII